MKMMPALPVVSAPETIKFAQTAIAATQTKFTA
jgi:hypothetical protein